MTSDSDLQALVDKLREFGATQCDSERALLESMVARSTNVRVVIGPAAECHEGINRPLLKTPPPGVTYARAPYRYVFTFPGISSGARNPFSDFSICESIDIDVAPYLPCVVHAFLTPIRSPVPWILHTDMLFPLQSFGQTFAVGSTDRVRRGDIPRSEQRLRERMMALQFVGSHCRALVFYTEASRKVSEEYLSTAKILTQQEAARLAEKTKIAYPTLPYTAQPVCKFDKMTVIYVGRNYSTKRGDLAITLFRDLAARYGATTRFIFVGEAPDGSMPADGSIEYHPFMAHDKYLQLLERCHIFFYPTRRETYGMAYVEAANRGLAIVGSGTPGVPHIAEWFTEGVNGYFVRTDLSDAMRLELFGRNLRALIENPEQTGAMAENNRQLFLRGLLSMNRYYDNLKAAYARALEKPHLGDCGGEDTLSALRACNPCFDQSYTEDEYQQLLLEVTARKSIYEHL